MDSANDNTDRRVPTDLVDSDEKNLKLKRQLNGASAYDAMMKIDRPMILTRKSPEKNRKGLKKSRKSPP